MTEKKNIYQIAEELKVSPGTVSKALNNTGRISKKTREMILEHVKNVNFVPATIARNLKSKRTYIIGIIISNESEYSFFTPEFYFFKKFVESNGYEISFITKKVGIYEMDYYDWCMNKRVEGVYIIGDTFDEHALSALTKSSIPCITNYNNINNCLNVTIDYNQSMSIVFDYIKNLKLNSVGIITKSDFWIESYRKHLTSYGFPIKDEYTITPKSLDSNYYYEFLLNELKRLKKLPEAFLIDGDELLKSLLKVLHELKLSIPSDLQIIGIGDIKNADCFFPSITTINVTPQLLGTMTGSILIKAIEKNVDNHQKTTKLSSELIIRSSSK